MYLPKNLYSHSNKITKTSYYFKYDVKITPSITSSNKCITYYKIYAVLYIFILTKMYGCRVLDLYFFIKLNDTGP